MVGPDVLLVGMLENYQVILLVLFVLALMYLVMRITGRRFTELKRQTVAWRDELKEKSESISGGSPAERSGGARRGLDNVVVELHEFAREVEGRLDTKVTYLRKLLEEVEAAEKRIDRKLAEARELSIATPPAIGGAAPEPDAPEPDAPGTDASATSESSSKKMAAAKKSAKKTGKASSKAMSNALSKGPSKSSSKPAGASASKSPKKAASSRKSTASKKASKNTSASGGNGAPKPAREPVLADEPSDEELAGLTAREPPACAPAEPESRAAPGEDGEPEEVRGRLVDVRVGETVTPATESEAFKRVVALHDSGKDAGAIADELGLPKGEVLLMVGLHQSRESAR